MKPHSSAAEQYRNNTKCIAGSQKVLNVKMRYTPKDMCSVRHDKHTQ